jgi:hypothetical protein
MVTGSPFTPTFGVTPPVLVGRDEEVEAFDTALAEGVGSPGRAMLLTGPRGSGKTVTLNALEDRAAARRWLVASETARRGVAGDLEQRLRVLLEGLLGARGPVLTGLSASVMGTGGSVDLEPARPRAEPTGFRAALTALADAAAERGGGVLVTIDEVHVEAIDDLRAITQAVQHCFREGREVAVVAAGLPSSVGTLLDDTVTTFLRRAERFTLGSLDPQEVRRGLREPILTAGRSISPRALDVAVTGTDGQPFLVQLVGHQMWSVQPEADLITVAHARAGVQEARRRVGLLVHEPELRPLSDTDRAFLVAMCEDDGPSRMSDLARRLGADANFASQYRLRLIREGLIEATGHGRVDFVSHTMRDYLREHGDDVLGGGPARRRRPGGTR